MSTIGLISDTHGLLRPQALDALRGVRHIVHAGDIGDPELLLPLEGLAPFSAVRGNVDYGPWADRLPATIELEIDGVWLYALHVLDDLDIDPRGGGFDVVIYGHSHRPTIETKGGVLYVNPGSAGPRRFRLPVSVALLHLEPDGPRAEIVTLDV